MRPDTFESLPSLPLPAVPAAPAEGHDFVWISAAELAQLRAEPAQLRAGLAAQQQQLVELEEKLAAALAEIQRLTQGGTGNPAPFSKGKAKPHPKKPGRKPGQGKFTHRQAPDFSGCDVTEETAPLDAPHCPDCGGRLGIEWEDASTTEAPEAPRPRVHRFRVEVGRCTCCARTHRGRHPLLKPDQFGATAHRVGPRVYAYAHWLHYSLGIPVRKLPAVLRQLLGISLTQGALTQDALRRVGDLAAATAMTASQDPAAAGAAARTGREPGPLGWLYLALRAAIAEEPVVHTDDTSWRIAGRPAWMMVFVSMRIAVFQIRYQHRNEEVREVLRDFLGVLVCDRGPSYNSRHLAGWRQQKCLSHLIKNISTSLPFLPASRRGPAEQLLALFREALALWHSYHAGTVTDYAAAGRALASRIDTLLAPVTHLNPVLNTLLNGIGRQHDRGHVLRFLDDPAIPPTNNHAERSLRPGVLARKVSQCSRTDPGATAHAAWVSVVTTLRMAGISDPIAAILECMRTGRILGLDLPDPRVSGASPS